MAKSNDKTLVLITGTSSGIGLATAKKFLDMGCDVVGIDLKAAAITHANYTHYVADISKPETLPDVEGVNILVNNAGVQNANDIDVNLRGTINVTEKYAFQPAIRAVVNVASASAHTGAEFAEYSASKGGVLAYTKHVALNVAKYGATCNSLSPGGVLTELNKPVIEDEGKWARIMALTPLKKWATADEIAEWIYFIAAVNKSMTAQDILIDNGESSDAHFVW